MSDVPGRPRPPQLPPDRPRRPQPPQISPELRAYIDARRPRPPSRPAPEATFVDPSPPLNAATRRANPKDPNRLKGVLGKALGNIDPAAAERVFDVLTQGGAQAPESQDEPPNATIDVSPVSSFPGSSRCAAARYVFEHEVLLMTWTNGKTPWVYYGVPFEVFTTFLSAPSHGKFVNEVLNNFAHRRVYQGDTYSEFIYGVMPNA